MIQFEKLIVLLHEAGIDFVMIGGLATIFHGGDYQTKDVDCAITRRRENCRAIASALAPYHPKPVDWPEGVPFVWDAQTIMNATTLTLVTDLGRIDFLAEPDGAPPYEELKARAVTFDLEGRTIYVACIEDLIAMKRAAGRPKDLGQAAELETIQRLMDEQS